VDAPSSADLVRYLNRESKKLQAITCQDLDIDVKDKGILVPTVRGNMICQKPRNFRLTGKAAGSPQIDFGSNDEQFWFWVKQGAPVLFHCNYSDFEKGVNMPFPFQPEWVVQALGMSEYSDPANYQVEVKGNQIELIENSTVQGKPVRKTTRFNSAIVAPPTPQITGYVMLDANGKTLCSASVKEVRQMQLPNGEWAIYPRKVQLEWPIEQMRLELTLDKVSLNQAIGQEQTTRLFTRPNWPNIENYDLARGRTINPTANRIQRTGGYAPQP